MTTKKGRPRAPGPRYPSGKRKPIEGQAPTVWQRIVRLKDDIDGKRKFEADMRDSRMGSELHRLQVFDKITELEWSAGVLAAEIYEQHDRLKGATRRHAASPSFQGGSRGSDEGVDLDRMSPQARKLHDRRSRRVTKRWEDLQACLTPKERNLVEAVCINNQMIPPHEQAAFAVALRSIAKEFGIVAVASGGVTMRARKPRAGGGAAGTKPSAAPKRVNEQREAFMAAVGPLAPDASTADLDAAFSTMLARRDRAAFRRGKLRA